MDFAAAVTVRPGRAEDCADVGRMIRELAAFEKLSEQVKITDEGLCEDGFGQDPFYKCVVAELPPECRSKEGHTVIGYGLYYFTYSTWKGRNIYTEDLERSRKEALEGDREDCLGERLHPNEAGGAGLEPPGHRFLLPARGGGLDGCRGLALLPVRSRGPEAAGPGRGGHRSRAGVFEAVGGQALQDVGFLQPLRICAG
ncbi:uncharacterized protein LOC117659134 isoform X1 [Pantherophis guttatus]|uniref:Uncharacterized protein LOC117659134 isoform X1 n=1 Tax=Pantherophis guttatus TaxID=94885 RepID=A0ABM3YX16_PANGU|nr:uncharacterized protein LOC117659134 isoform X1 [Pantherophis guttatus]